MTHGHSVGGKPSPTYLSWRAMKQRCEYSKGKDYSNYGGRGIEVDRRWNSFKQFLLDMGVRPSKEYSLDRIDPNKNYIRENCQWILKSENSSKGNKQKYSDRGPIWFDRVCLYCNKDFKVRRAEVRKGHGKFCSISCAITYRNYKGNREGGVGCC